MIRAMLGVPIRPARESRQEIHGKKLSLLTMPEEGNKTATRGCKGHAKKRPKSTLKQVKPARERCSGHKTKAQSTVVHQEGHRSHEKVLGMRFSAQPECVLVLVASFSFKVSHLPSYVHVYSVVSKRASLLL